MKTQIDKRIDGLPQSAETRNLYFSRRPPAEGYKNGDVWFQTADYTEQFDKIMAASQYDSENHEWALKGAFVSDGGEETSYIDTYSTSEVKTNKIWIDGKPIYRLVYLAPIPDMVYWNNLGNYPIAPGTAEYDLSSKITGTISTVTAFSGIYYWGSAIHQMITDCGVWKQEYELTPGINVLELSDKKIWGLEGLFTPTTKKLNLTNYSGAYSTLLYVTLEYTKTEE